MTDPFDDVVGYLATTQRSVCLTAAAGCGKTEAIVRAVAQSEGKQLVLTHTNAGVAALRSRLRRYSVSESKCHVETIASWLLKYVIAYPSMSGLANLHPVEADWGRVYPAAQRLFICPFVKDVLRASYAGIFVDEYQDCTRQQHQIILKICEYGLPVRVLGDPLQGIFGFSDPLVEWRTDVEARFEPLPELLIPYRWKQTINHPYTNPSLGEQLVDVRKKLLAWERVKLDDYSEIKWQQWSDSQEQAACKMVRSGTIAGIHQWPLDAHATARQMAGEYQSIEEMDCKELMKASRQIDMQLKRGNYQAIVNCLKSLILKGCGNQSLFNDAHYLQSEFSRLERGDLSAIIVIMETIILDCHAQVFRRELLIELKRAAQEFATGQYASLEEAAYIARYKTRVNGRKPEARIISRTLLIKGLEFDHALILNADKLQNRENFYVAITRGSKSLTVLSSSPAIHYPQPS